MGVTVCACAHAWRVHLINALFPLCVLCCWCCCCRCNSYTRITKWNVIYNIYLVPFLHCVVYSDRECIIVYLFAFFCSNVCVCDVYAINGYSHYSRLVCIKWNYHLIWNGIVKQQLNHGQPIYGEADCFFFILISNSENHTTLANSSEHWTTEMQWMLW